MPGLTDAHTHASGTIPKAGKGAEEPLPGVDVHFMQAELRDYLRFGVTTIRVTGSQGLLPQQARQAMRYGAFRGPRLLTCGKIISATAPGGRFYGDMYVEADGPDNVRRAVREQIRWGADFVKVMTTGARSNELEDPDPLQFTDPELAALTDEAHRLGYRVSAHAEGLDGCAAAIKHGVDTIEHGMYLNQRPDLLDAMAAGARCWYRPCPGTTGCPAWPLTSLIPRTRQPSPTCPLYWLNWRSATSRRVPRSMRAARDAGVKIALGSDTRLAVGLELQRMIHHGLTPDEALVAATRAAAEALGLDEYIGTVAEGKLADLIVVDGDPLHEPHVLSDPERIWLVLQLGEPVAGQYLVNPALGGQFASPDRPAAPQPSDMEGWAARSRAAQ